MLNILTNVSLGVFAAANLSTPFLAQTPPGVEELVGKLGALGLCAFMVFQNYRQSEAMARVLREKDSQLVALTEKKLDVDRKHAEAIEGLSAALRERPCLVGDRRFDEQREKV